MPKVTSSNQAAESSETPMQVDINVENPSSSKVEETSIGKLPTQIIYT